MSEPTELELAVAQAILLRTMTSPTAETPRLERMRALLADASQNELAAERVREAVLDARAAVEVVFAWMSNRKPPLALTGAGLGTVSDAALARACEVFTAVPYGAPCRTAGRVEAMRKALEAALEGDE